MIEELKAKIKDLAAAYKQIATQKLTEFKSAAPQTTNEDAPQSTSAEAPQATSAAAKSISGSVGKGGTNAKADVITVQTLLKAKGYPIAVDGDCGNKTIAAIADFQTKKFGKADGRIDPGGKTWTALAGSAPVTPVTPFTPVTPVTPITPATNSDLGVGAENTDGYESQRDNKMLDLKNSTSSYNGGKESGDVQCNVTSLAMQLVGLADGDKAKVIKLVKAQLDKRKATIDPSWGLEEMLGTLVDKLGISIFGASGLAAVCKLLPELVKSTELIWTFDKATFANKIVPALKSGAEIILSGKFTHGGHICSLLGVRNDGIVINDPYGCNLATGVYFKNGGVGTKSHLTTYKDTLARRLSLNGKLQAVIDAANAGKAFTQDIGKQNFYSWDDVSKVGLKWIQIAYKA